MPWAAAMCYTPRKRRPREAAYCVMVTLSVQAAWRVHALTEESGGRFRVITRIAAMSETP